MGPSVFVTENGQKNDHINLGTNFNISGEILYADLLKIVILYLNWILYTLILRYKSLLYKGGPWTFWENKGWEPWRCSR